MGPSKIDETKQVPDFIEHNYSKAIAWAKRYGVQYSITFDTEIEGKVGDVIKQTPDPGTYFNSETKLKLIVKAGIQEIKFNSNGHGTAPGSIQMITGDEPFYFKNMENVYEGSKTYIFKGWYTSPGSDGVHVYSTDEVSGDVTLYAHWVEQSEITYYYSFVANGNELSSGTVKAGETPSAPSAPAIDGYTFVGWSPSVGPLYSDTTFTAIYEQDAPPVEICNDESASNYGLEGPCVFPDPGSGEGGE
jgi:uncharacterized repeat protein (TIGR02543 family)